MSSIGFRKNGLTGTGRRYWRSLDDYAQTPEFRELVAREFPSLEPDVLHSDSRRSFLKVMGASLALAGLTGCRWPQEKILPFTQRPEDRMPGVPAYYATSMELAGVARGLVVTSYDGRPIKVEGNPLHPESRGASDRHSQASVLEVYDPDRRGSLIERADGQTFTRSWDEFAGEMAPQLQRLRDGGGDGLAFLTEATSSPTQARLRERCAKVFPRARWFEYEAVSRDNERAGSALAFGAVLRAHPAYDQARVIVSLDEDFLVSHPAAVKYARDFIDGRRTPTPEFNRLYVAETHFSPTGALADHRVPLPPSRIPALAGAIAAELFLSGDLAVPGLDPALREMLEAHRREAPRPEFVRAAADDLRRHRGRSLIVTGSRQPAWVHALTHWMNVALGNVGRTLRYTETPDPERPSHVEAMKALAEAARRGSVQNLLILGGNPVYDAPADLEFAELLGRLSWTAHLGTHLDETSRACRWHLPRAHYLESWGDARAYGGTVSLVQPLIRPLYDGKSSIEVLALFLGEDTTRGYDLVRETCRGLFGGGGDAGFERRWRRSLHDGVIPDTGYAEVSPELDAASFSSALAGKGPTGAGDGSPGALEIELVPDPAIYDGRFANNGWLQELPDSLTKIAWDNAALLAPTTARSLGLRTGDLIRLEDGDRAIEIVAYIMPGQAAGAATLALGHGRTAAGRVGDGVGFDVGPLRTSGAMDARTGVRVVATGKHYDIFSSQDHFPLDAVGARGMSGRLDRLVREATLEEHLQGRDREEAAHSPALQLWEAHPYEGNRWGMAVDLNACTGCNACVIACQSENNIPVVGKVALGHGREMQWIRIDRYFRGDDPDHPEASFQPVTCQQCENAPCEQVCPVGATMHSSEGLNDMVYNRCIGTRYCLNNCPYKVRRFNFFNYNGPMTATEKMRSNPEVTVRSRGVMEKCSFCIQRIAAVRIAAKNERRPIHDGEITPACAQACPPRAITFGDLNDPESRVRRAHEDDRAYAMLEEELHTRPRLHYLSRLRNPSPALSRGETGSEGGA